MASRLVKSCLIVCLAALLPGCKGTPSAVMSVASSASLHMAVRLSHTPYRTQYLSQLDWDTAEITLTPEGEAPITTSASAALDPATGNRSATFDFTEVSSHKPYHISLQLLRRDRAGATQVVAECVRENVLLNYGPNSLSLEATPTASADKAFAPSQPELPGAMALTIAGSPRIRFPEVPAVTGQVNYPYGVAAAPDGTVYVADSESNLIRKISPDGQMSTLAGTGEWGYQDGPALEAKFSYPACLAVGLDGTVFVSDMDNNVIRQISPDGQVTTLAGTAGQSGYVEGQGAAARFDGPDDLDLGPDGNLYLADSGNHAIRKITLDGTVTTVVGNGSPGTSASASANCLNQPDGVELAPDGTLYVGDYGNHRLVSVQGGTVTTVSSGSVAAAGAELTETGELFYLDSNGHKLMRYAGGINTVVAGAGSGYVDGVGTAARFYYPNNLSYANGAIYVADLANSRVRKVAIDTQGTPSVSDDVYTVSTYAGNGWRRYQDGSRSLALMDCPMGLDFDAQGNLLVIDNGNMVVRKVTLDGQASTLAGSGQQGSANGPLLSAQFNNPNDLVVDRARNKVYVSDTNGHRIRVFNADGTGSVATFAGTGAANFDAGTVAAASARFNKPRGMGLGPDGSVYVADYNNHCVRVIRDAGGGSYQVSVLAGTNASGFVNGVGTAARFNNPYDVAVASDGTVYVADCGNDAIRKIVVDSGTGTATVSTLAGGASAGFVDGTGVAAQFDTPDGVEIEPDGNLLVSDWGNWALRRVTPAGNVTTVVGDGSFDYADGALGLARLEGIGGMAVNSNGELYFSDYFSHTIRKIVP